SSQIPVAVLKNQNFYTIPWDYDAGKVYTVYVRARNLVDSQVVSPKRSLRFGVAAYKPVFLGLQESGVRLSDDGTEILLTWEAAVGVVGDVEYLVFDSNTFVTPLAITQETSFT